MDDMLIPIPWYVTEHGAIASVSTGRTVVHPGVDLEDLSRRHLIVRAVNNHDALVAALLAQEAFDNHCVDCEDCQYGPLCEAGIGLSAKAQALRKDAIAAFNGPKAGRPDYAHWVDGASLVKWAQTMDSLVTACEGAQTLLEGLDEETKEADIRHVLLILNTVLAKAKEPTPPEGGTTTRG